MQVIRLKRRALLAAGLSMGSALTLTNASKSTPSSSPSLSSSSQPPSARRSISDTVSLMNVESLDSRGVSLAAGGRAGSRARLTGASNRSVPLVYSSPLDVPLVAQYCNSPTGVTLGEEGEAPEDFFLTSVYAVIRHGDRTPMTAYLDVPRPSPRNGCTMKAEVLQSIPDLGGFLADMEEQKDKQAAGSEFSKWAMYPQHRQCSNSQLTGEGALQHLLGGLALREKYIKRWDLLGPRFSPATQLDLRSTQVSRTYQSGLALLYGLLPRFNISQLDVRMAKSSVFCSPSLVPASCCQNQNKLKHEADKGRHKRGAKNPAWLPAMGALAEVFDVKISQLPWATALMDMLQGHACHGLDLPCGPQGRCVTPAIMDKLWTLVVSDAQSYNKDARFDRYSRTLIHPLLLDILTSMVKVASNRSPVKFTLFSGHDLTISPLLQALGVHNGVWPHYASRVIFELYRKKRAQGESFLRVVHNGRDITGLVRFCHGRTQAGMCQLKHFKAFVEKDNMEVMGVKDWRSLDAFCRSNVQP